MILFLIINCLTSYSWSWVSKEEPYKCIFEELGGTIPDTACDIRNFLIKTKKILENNQNEQGLKSKIQFHNAYLFYGPAGIGKTTTAKCIPEEASVKIEYHSANNLRTEIYENNGEPSIIFAKIYEHARQTAEKEHRPVLIVIDDIEKFSTLKGNVVEAIFGSLAYQLDKHLDNPYITTIYISNNIKSLEHAFLTRCIKVQWLQPQTSNREAIIRFYLKRNNIVLSESDNTTVEKLAKNTHDFNGRDFKFAFYHASIIAEQNELTKEVTLANIEEGVRVRKKEIDAEKKTWLDAIKNNPKVISSITASAIGIIYYLITGRTPPDPKA